MKTYAMAIVGGNRVQIKPLDQLFLHSLDHPRQTLVVDILEDFDN